MEISERQNEERTKGIERERAGKGEEKIKTE